MQKKVMVVFGTRPEAIKMAPVIRALRERPNLRVQVVITAQHRHMLDQVLRLFDIAPDVDLDLMRHGQSLDEVLVRACTGVGAAIRNLHPDLVLVHGDTTTTLAAALAAFHARVPVGHVEAGLRTDNLDSPWPEEANRRLVTTISRLHFAPTPHAKDNLVRNGVDERRIFVTGNTVIDALVSVTRQFESQPASLSSFREAFSYLDPNKRMLLVTGHRRENFGAGFDEVCEALAQLAQRPDIEIVYPVHLNPRAREPVRRRLSGLPNVFLVEPLEYAAFAYAMSKAYLIISDSGGVQEEAPSLGKPVLVTRNLTERPEAVAAGTVKLVGTDGPSLISAATELLDSPSAYAAMATARNPYGDGNAAVKIASVVGEWCSKSTEGR